MQCRRRTDGRGGRCRCLEASASLTDLLGRQAEEPETAAVYLVRRGPPPYPLTPVPVPGVPGKLFVSRTPGLQPNAMRAEMEALLEMGVRCVVCLVPDDELERMHGGLAYPALGTERLGDRFVRCPMPDCGVPLLPRDLDRSVAHAFDALVRGETVLVHCLAGCGRSGTFVASLLTLTGMPPREAVRHFRRQRRCGPDTEEQLAEVVCHARRADVPSEEKVERFPWLREVAQLRLTTARTGEWVVLGRGGLADVVLGRLRVAGSTRRVAVKLPRVPWTDEAAVRLQTSVEALRGAGVHLPKMLLYPFRGARWVQVSSLFGSRTRGTRLEQPNLYYRSLEARGLRDVAQQLARVARTGYTPTLDLFVTLRDRKIPVPIDLDLVTLCPDERARSRSLLRCIASLSDESSVRRDLLYRVGPEIDDALRSSLEAELKTSFAGYF